MSSSPPKVLMMIYSWNVYNDHIHYFADNANLCTVNICKYCIVNKQE